MTSGSFHSVPTAAIQIDRASRQRRELVGIEILAESIARLGLINPITITRDHVLVAGERRLTAIRSLGWTHVSAQYIDEVDPAGLRAIELEENIKRVDLTWQDQVSALREYHEYQRSHTPEWLQSDTASALGLDPSEVSRKLLVADEIFKGNERVIAAPKYSVARGIVERERERADNQELGQLAAVVAARPTTVAGTTVAPGPLAGPVEPKPVYHSILNTDFNSWAPEYAGPKFNLIHCDFPYGINADGFAQGSAAAHGGYRDNEETYWTLCRTLASNLDRLASESCHLIFWHSMKFYRETLDFFSKETDFVLDLFPLVWLKSDNAGILPDPSRGPRRIYEVAFFGQRGDRKVVQAVANAYAAPTVRDRHMSEKPEPMLRHFFRMVVDHHTILLDPTAGSGSAIRAAESLNAKYSIGLEANPEFAARAQTALEQARKLRKASNGTPVSNS